MPATVRRQELGEPPRIAIDQALNRLSLSFVVLTNKAFQGSDLQRLIPLDQAQAGSGADRVQLLFVANQNQLCAADLGKNEKVPHAARRNEPNFVDNQDRSPVQAFARSQAREEVGQGVTFNAKLFLQRQRGPPSLSAADNADPSISRLVGVDHRSEQRSFPGARGASTTTIAACEAASLAAAA